MRAYEIIFDSTSKETKRVELDVKKLKRHKDPSSNNRGSTLWLLDVDVADKMRVLYPSQIVFE